MSRLTYTIGMGADWTRLRKVKLGEALPFTPGVRDAHGTPSMVYEVIGYGEQRSTTSDLEGRLGWVERRDRVPVFDGATPHNRSGWRIETQWVAFLADGRSTDEAHETRAAAVEELVRRAIG